MEFISQLGIIPFNFDVLASNLKDYKSPRQKIIELEKQRIIIRLKRGMYVVAPQITKRAISTELIANHLYGPSYVSMESALWFYGLIPERVFNTTSMTLKRSRTFNNYFGHFNYIFCPANYYSIGVSQIVREDYAFLIASPEKALCDLIVYTPKLRLRSIKSLQTFLEDDIRLDMDEFYKMDKTIFEQCLYVSKKKNEINNLVKLLKR